MNFSWNFMNIIHELFKEKSRIIHDHLAGVWPLSLIWRQHRFGELKRENWQIFDFLKHIADFINPLLTVNTKARGPRYTKKKKPKIISHVNIPRMIQFLHLQSQKFYKIFKI